MSGLDWAIDGRNWPNRAASRFVRAGGLTFHVQVAGEGPDALLLHGTGASTHSWRGLFPLLARTHRVIALDLPGHAFTDPLSFSRLSLPGMAEAVGALVRKLDAHPKLAIGHSAGAAVAIRMTLDGQIAPQAIVSLNGALLPIWTGFTAPFFASIAKLLALNPFAPWLFARQARDPATVDRLLKGTGSAIPEQDVRLYRLLAGTSSHVRGAIGMMAGWDLKNFERDLARLKTPLLLVAGVEDGMVPASSADDARERIPHATVARLDGLGHLAHEEAPERVLAAIGGFLRQAREPAQAASAARPAAPDVMREAAHA